MKQGCRKNGGRERAENKNVLSVGRQGGGHGMGSPTSLIQVRQDVYDSEVLGFKSLTEQDIELKEKTLQVYHLL